MIANPDPGRRVARSRVWQAEVAERLTGHKVPMFAMMAIFASPILRFSNYSGNICFELVGPNAIGKSMVLRFAASVIGNPSSASGNPYWTTFAHTMNDIDDQFQMRGDLPLLLDGADAFFAGVPVAKRVALLKPFASRMLDGRRSGRRGQPAGRHVCLTSSTVSLAKLVDSPKDVFDMSGDRMFTIEIESSVLATIPGEFANASAFAQSLLSAATDNYGYAMRIFLKNLVDEAAVDESFVSSFIESRLEEFRTQAKIDRNDGVADRAANAFGVIYAAGELAKRYGVLPREWHCGRAALAMYRKALGARLPLLSLAEQIRRAAARPGVVHIGTGQPALSPDEAAAARVFINHRKGEEELLIRREWITSVIPDWKRLEKAGAFDGLLKPESKGKKYTRRRLAGGGDDEPVYCFTIPAAPEPTNAAESDTSQTPRASRQPPRRRSPTR